MTDFLCVKQGVKSREFYKHTGFNQQQLAKKLEIPQASISAIEKGKKAINHGILNKIAIHYKEVNLEC